MYTVKRASHITLKQKELLIKFIEDHPEMNSGKFSETYTRAKAKQLWMTLTNALNAIPGSPVKDWTQWRKSWIDIKKNTKSRISKSRQEKLATGGGKPISQEIDNLDESVINIISPTSIVGDKRIPQPIIKFDFSATDDIQEIEESTMIEESDIEMPNMESKCSEDKTELVISKNVNTRNKFVSKSMKLNKSLENSEKLLSQSGERLTLQEKYYNKKIEIMERDIENKEAFMEKSIEIGLNLLAEMKELKQLLKP